MRNPFERWLPLWRDPATWRADLMAGLTGAVVVLPQGMAFATLAGVPAQYGLYAAMLPCIVAALAGSSRLMVTGPANAISLTTMALIAPLAEVGSDRYIHLVLTLSFLVGTMQILLGAARAGMLVDRVPHSVVVGFTTGAAVLIVNSQIGHLLGIELPRGNTVWTNVGNAMSQIGQSHVAAVIAAVVTVAVAIAWRPYNRRIPAMLVSLLAGTLAATLVAWVAPSLPKLATVSAVPSALPTLSMPDLSIETVRSLFGATLVMTLLALTEAVAIAKAVALRHNDVLDGNREFLGQGLANLTGSFFSAMPCSGSFNRSGVNVQAGARTPMAAASAAVFLGVILLFVAPSAELLPLAVIAGLLLVVASGLIDRREIVRVWREEPAERLPLAVTLVCTVTLSLEWAILLGVVSAVIIRRRFPRLPQ